MQHRPASLNALSSFLTDTNIKLTISDLLGREITTMTLNDLITPLDISSCPLGVYIIAVFVDGKINQSIKFKKL